MEEFTKTITRPSNANLDAKYSLPLRVTKAAETAHHPSCASRHFAIHAAAIVLRKCITVQDNARRIFDKEPPGLWDDPKWREGWWN